MGIGNFIDSVIAPFAPRLCYKRMIARSQMEMIFQAQQDYKKSLSLSNSDYEGAAKNRTNSDWNARLKTADAYSMAALPDLIARTRWLTRNTPIGRSIVNSYRRNVVGCGIVPNAAATDESGNSIDDFNEKADRAFMEWANDPKLCDVEKRLTFWEIQRQTMDQLIDAGEIFIRIVMVQTRGLRHISIQRFEIDQLDIFRIRNETTGNEIRRGIEINKHGAPVAYHFLDRPRNDAGLQAPAKTHRIPASQIKHIFMQDRPGQTHGIPLLAPVISKLRQLEEFEMWELFAARVQACVAITINKETPLGNTGTLRKPSGDDGLDDDGNPEDLFQPGMIFTGKPGEDVKGFVPTRPGNTYEPFVVSQMRNTSAGVGLSYEQVSRDFSKGNYSSLRQSLLEDRRAFECWQSHLNKHLNNAVWNEFIQTSVLNGTLEASGYFENQSLWNQVDWLSPGFPWIDPLREAKANIALMDKGLTTAQAVSASRGQDWRVNYRQAKKEKEFRKKLGLDDFDHIKKPFNTNEVGNPGNGLARLNGSALVTVKDHN